MRRIGVLTSGGDSPGMNAAIRAVVRTAAYHNIEVFGIKHGYQGLIDNDMLLLQPKDVANILQRGGTILKTKRCKAFFEKEGRKTAYENLKANHIDALVVIGGDGTFTGADILLSEYPDLKIVGLSGTIDNDLYGTDFTIGYDTAINTVIEAVDKVRDTADSHNRLFLVEVMGKDAGFIALRGGIAAGAESILVPESSTYSDHLIQKLKSNRREKESNIVLIAEGNKSGGAYEIEKIVRKECPEFDTRVLVLGHIQRGGSPTAMDRVRASQMGYEAVNALLRGQSGVMVGIVNKEFAFTPFSRALKHHDKMNQELLKIAEILSL